MILAASSNSRQEHTQTSKRTALVEEDAKRRFYALTSLVITSTDKIRKLIWYVKSFDHPGQDSCYLYLNQLDLPLFSS